MKKSFLFTLCVGFVFWIFWPIIIHYVEKSHTFLEITYTGGTPSRVEEQQMAGSYVAFNALFTLVTVIITLSTYLKTKEKEVKQKIQTLEISTFSRFFNLYDEFEKTLLHLAYKNLNGYEVIEYFYKKYRVEELTCIAEDDQVKLAEMDKCFEKEAKEAGLFVPAMKMYSIFNWIRALDFYLTSVEKKNTPEIAMSNQIYLRTLDNLINAKIEFVFGKYRHHYYKVEKMTSGDGVYRGANYADQVLKYERTLKKVHLCDKMIIESIEKRYNDEESEIPKSIRLISFQ